MNTTTINMEQLHLNKEDRPEGCSHAVPVPHQAVVHALQHGWNPDDGEFGLLSVTVNGQETSAIVRITEQDEDHVAISPIFVGVVAGMELQAPFGPLKVEVGSAEALEQEFSTLQ